MKSSFRVEVTETSVVILANSRLLTSIPLRRWSTIDGTTWSSRLRTPTEIDRLVAGLTHELQDGMPDSVMKRVLRVLSMESLIVQGRNTSAARQLPSRSPSRCWRPRVYTTIRHRNSTRHAATV